MAVNGQLTLAATKIEVAPALANIHFDFTLCRVEPPEEFRGVGKVLSAKRRIEAEEGNQHVIARRLGALFESAIPSCNDLIKAYGTRASEISASTTTEQRQRSYGMFAGSIGIDATSLWAAATSGPTAIAVHLLACMLARMWNAAEATSIWVEIVKRRKEEIITQFAREQAVETGALLSAKQEITREQIRIWDASARAWLRAADAAKRTQQTQLMLILDNLLGPVNTKPDTYESVMDAWKVSTTQMNCLIQGTAQKAQRGDILLALSCWHLYPDMVSSKTAVFEKDLLYSTRPFPPILPIRYNELLSVCRWKYIFQLFSASFPSTLLYPRLLSSSTQKEINKLSVGMLTKVQTIVTPSAAHISQKDPLFPSGGVVTIGLMDNSSVKKTGVYWSLPLAHLRHYGKPVVSEASINTTEQSRITPHQFMMAVLGCVLGSWHATGESIMKHSRWLSILGRELTKLTDKGLQSAVNLLEVKGEYTWLKLITEAASSYVNSSGNERSVAAKLINLGRRYGENFLGHPREPMFGLTTSGKWVFALKDDERRIALLRTIATKASSILGIQPHEIFIRYRRNVKHATYEYATALPIGSLKRKFDNLEVLGDTGSHIRWLNDGQNFNISFNNLEVSQQNTPFENNHEWAMPPINSDLSAEELHGIQKDFEARALFLKSKGERVESRASTVIDELEPSKRGVLWNEYSSFFRFGPPNVPPLPPKNPYSDTGLSSIKIHGEPWAPKSNLPIYQFLWGDISTGALFVSKISRPSLDSSLGFGNTFNLLQEYSDPSHLDYSKIALHLQLHFDARSMIGDSYEASLRAAATAASIYRNLPGAFVDVRILRCSVMRTGWVQSAMQRDMMKRKSSREGAYHERKMLKVTYYAHTLSERDASKDQEYFTQSDFGKLTNEAAKGLMDRSNHCRPLELLSLSLPETLACLAIFESGTHDIDPYQLKNARAMSAGDSIYVSACLVTDPSTKVPESHIRRLNGNIGRPGLAFLVPPSDPMFSEVDLARDWNSLDKELFDISKGNLDDRFMNTTLHLSFTGANVEIAVESRNSGGQDIEAYKLETLVNAYDGDKWVADLDIIKALRNKQFYRVSTCEGHEENYPNDYSIEIPPEVPGQAVNTNPAADFAEGLNTSALETTMLNAPTNKYPWVLRCHFEAEDDPIHTILAYQPTIHKHTHRNLDNMVAIDNWLCLLDAKGNELSIVRSQGNWEARLATTSLSIALGNATVVLPPQVCWQCCKEMMERKAREGPQPSQDTIIIA